MAHLIAKTARNTDAFAYTGDAAWHNLGQRLHAGASLDTWAREAGFDFSALASPVKFARADGTVGFMGDKVVLYRSDTGAPLACVGDGYKVVQPAEVLEFFRDLTESNQWELHTAGVLEGGRKFWAMARPKGGHQESIGDDSVRLNLLLATSLDGTMRTHAAFTTVRVVCANTLRFAFDDIKANKRRAASVSHRSEFDPSAIKEQLGLADTAFGQFMANARKLAAVQISEVEARDLLRELIGKPAQAKADAIAIPTTGDDFARLLKGSPLPVVKAPKEHRNVTRVLELFNGQGIGSNMASAKGTAWGLLSAVTQFVDHEATRNPDARIVSGFFGKGDELKSDTFAALLARA